MGAELALEAAAHDDGYAAIVADGPSGRTFADLHDAGLSMLERVVSYPSTLVFDLTVATLAAERPAAALTSLSPQVTEPVLYIASGQVAIERSLVTKVAEESAGDYDRSEAPTTELQSLMRRSYAVFSLKKKKQQRSRTRFS